ncbi:MAG: hypothetical protein Q4B35_04180 [Slackia sp.]|nr:hypothetical protein [Slackia sp.]
MSDTLNPSGGAPVVPPASAPEDTAAMPQGAPAAPTSPAAGGGVPPTTGEAPYIPAPSAPQNIPGMPLMYLTGGMKFGWAAAGLLMGPVAILLAWLTNAHNFPEAKNAAVKYSLFGFLAQVLLWVLVFGFFGCAACVAATSIPGYCYY